MGKIIIPDSSTLFTHASKVKEVSNLLFKYTDICHFHYTKLSLDNTFYTLSSSPEWQNHFFSNCFDPERYPKNQVIKTEYVLLDSVAPEIAKEAREFKLFNMLSIIKRMPDCHIVAGFATKENNYKLLEYFMRRPGRLVTRTMLLEQVWDMSFDPTTSVVETHISRLRAKIDKPFEEALLRTRRGEGYVFGK